MKHYAPINARLYTRSFTGWYERVYGADRARALPRNLILALEMMRLRSPLRSVRLLVHDPSGATGPHLLAYLRWYNERIRPGADPIVIRPGPLHLSIRERLYPGIRFHPLRRPHHIRGATSCACMVAMAHCCAPRPWGLDLFHRARTVLTGMVDIRHSILIFHGDMRYRRHHFRDAWHQARDDPDAVFLTYDADNPDAVLKDLQQRYQRPLREPSTTALLQYATAHHRHVGSRPAATATTPIHRIATAATPPHILRYRRPRPAERHLSHSGWHPIPAAPQRWSEPPPLAA